MNENNEAYELVESAAGYSGNLYSGLEKIVAELRGDRIKEAIDGLTLATEGLDWLIQAIVALNAVGAAYSGFDTDTIKGFLKEMLEAAENLDYVLLADLIEYEILPIIDVWGNKLDDILENNE